MNKRVRRFAAVAVAAVVSGIGASSVRAASPAAVNDARNQYFGWFINITPSYLTSPVLNDQTAPSLDAWLKSQPSNLPKAVKIWEPISNSTANLIFNNPKYNISYVLGDLEHTTAVSDVTRLVNQVRNGNANGTGPKLRSANAFIGNFGFTGLDNDVTRPSNYNSQKGTHSFSGFSANDYKNAKLNMSMPELYPGSASFRNPAAGNSSAPNIRSALFVLPALRLSQTTIAVGEKTEIVPYITNFNNWLTPALDTDRNPGNGYKFIPGQALPAGGGLPFISAADTANQMLSRRDTAAQVLHYRLRGADTFVAFEQGVIGRNNEQFRLDAKAGWEQSNVNNIFAASDDKLLLGKDSDYPPPSSGDKDPNGNIFVDGVEKTIESAGAMFSGVYSLSLQKMDVLLSNMDDEDHDLTIPSKIAGFDVKTKTFDVDPGQHLLIEFKLTNSGPQKGWSVLSIQTPFLNLNNDRNQIGIPEPTTVWAGIAAGMWAMSRRNRRGDKKKAEKVTHPIGLCAGNLPGDVFIK